MYPEIEVDVSDTQGHLRVDPATLEHLVRVVLAAENRSSGSISIALVDNATIGAIHRKHLGQDGPTDVISFPLNDPDDLVLAGELVISTEMACNVAREIGVEPSDELALYVVHGLLHLCGYDDHDDTDRCRMRRREEEILSRAGVTVADARGGEALLLPVESGEGEAPRKRPEHHDKSAGLRLVAHELEGRPWTA
jgi:probable rRNA maturation factor